MKHKQRRWRWSLCSVGKLLGRGPGQVLDCRTKTQLPGTLGDWRELDLTSVRRRFFGLLWREREILWCTRHRGKIRHENREAQRNTATHSEIQRNTLRRSGAQRNATEHNETQRGTAKRQESRRDADTQRNTTKYNGTRGGYECVCVCLV